ncbi:peptidoglycan D,D-transpeptidase FtsI family protein [Parasporobacterium paucivorans]|uniref:Peptidoglycan glycosyltransferase n=1 Tax=Parasporobacterium paucivorans DSM 15970 TaxID=1122934 RepID=A0A1M6ABJ6_9FIRM|nr:penicillin-binding transpeptidase domain-containing protein [Parasporobacterium paucivorans]SHI33797.1 peptidoglycan glycosyltransferase [Parasporobacterium paucivorans DSM 15970]
MGKKRKKNPNNEIMKITYVFIALFVAMIGYFVYFMVFQSRDVINNSYNKRQDSFTEKIVRGTIYASGGEELAVTETDAEGNETRVYPFGNLFAHVIGINSHGRAGLELAYNFDLLTSNADTVEKIFNEFKGVKNIGDNISTTLEVGLQQAASDALGTNRGVIVAMEPDTGKVLAMVSKPDYDPNLADTDWASLSSDTEKAVLINRSTQGLYTPGSIFKIFTLLEYIRENPGYSDYAYDCNGSYTNGEYSVSCFNGKSHGHQNLMESFANSCNSSFVNIGLGLNLKSFRESCGSLLFNADLPIIIPYKRSSFTLNEDSGIFDVMQTSMGQGETLVTPMHMLMTVSAIANEGVLVTPRFVDRIESYTGNTVKTIRSQEYGNLITSDEASVLKEYMRAVVTEGTASELKSDSYTAYGKTGTAQVDSGDKAHSWFVGFAENGDKKIAICVLFEEMPSGTKWSVNAAKSVLDYYFR